MDGRNSAQKSTIKSIPGGRFIFGRLL